MTVQLDDVERAFATLMGYMSYQGMKLEFEVDDLLEAYTERKNSV